jgi:hypothetical protein
MTRVTRVTRVTRIRTTLRAVTVSRIGLPLSLYFSFPYVRRKGSSPSSPRHHARFYKGLSGDDREASLVISRHRGSNRFLSGYFVHRAATFQKMPKPSKLHVAVARRRGEVFHICGVRGK